MVALVGTPLFAACDGGDKAIEAKPADVSILSVGSTWQWQLQGEVNTSYDVDVYDIDLFDTAAQTVTELHTAGRIVVCYFSAGSYEPWRPDADRFSEADLGEPLDGFEEELWLDIRSSTVRSVIEARLDRAIVLGCDGVEPDNVTAYLNDSGFDLTDDDQLDFNRFVARAARGRGLLIGLKNDLEQIAELVDEFDFAVNEQCHEFDECDLNEPFLDAGKPVFNAEYADEYVIDAGSLCVTAASEGLRTLVLPLDLDDSFRIACDI